MISIALAVSFQSALVSVPMGYYTLGELERVLSSQGVEVSVGSSCRNDVYAVRLKDVTAKGLMEALASDQRLIARQSEGRWQVERNQANAAEESAALKKFQRAIAAPIHRVYGAVTQRLRYLETLSKAEKDAEVDRARAALKGPEGTAIANSIYWGAYGEAPFMQFSTIAAMTDPKAPPMLSKALLTTFYDSAILQSPSGTLDDHPLARQVGIAPAEQAAFYRSIQYGAKLVVDPLTLSVAFRATVYFRRNEVTLVMAKPPQAVELGQRLAVSPDAVWDRAALEAHSKRGTATAAVKEPPINEQSVTVSEALLRAAETTSANLIAHVSALSDFKIKPRGSVAGIVAATNTDGIDAGWLYAAASQRVSPNPEQSIARLPVLSTLTLTTPNGVFVVRNEMRFLDGWCAQPFPTSLSNELLKGKALSLDQVSAHVAGLNLKTWQSSLFSTRYLEIFNPASFRPIAVLITKSPSFKKALQDLADRTPRTFPYADLEPAARLAFEQALSDSSSQNDACGISPGSLEPMMAPIKLAEADRKALSLRIGRQADSYSFGVTNGNQVIWETWAKRVAP